MGVGPITPESAETLAEDSAFASRYAPLPGGTVFVAPPSGGDDRATIAAAITAAGVNGHVVYAKGTYLINGAMLVPLAGQTHQGYHRMGTTLKVGSDTITGTAMFTGSGVTGLTFRWLTLDGNADGTCVRGISVTGNGTKKNLLIDQCRFLNWRGSSSSAGVYVWTAENFRVIDCDFNECRIGVIADQAQGEGVIANNRIRNTTAASAAYGIAITSSVVVASGVVVIGNTVYGMNLDPAANGAGCHGIFVYKTRGVQIVGNTVDYCQCATSGGGMLIGGFSTECIAQGNTVTACATGIYVETAAASTDTTVGTGGELRGVVVNANHISGIVTVGSGIFGNGINVSYAAGSSITNNVVHACQGDGIVSDSDRCTISGNIVSNTWTSKSAPAQLSGTKAGIRVYGNKASIIGNQCFDTQTVKTQSYGIAVSDGTHSIVGNQTSGNATGGLYQQGGGASNSVAANL